MPVYLVGAGPGDPGLLTLKAKRCLEQADVVVYDYLVDQRILAYARPQAELIYAGKRSGSPSMSQADINRLIVDRAHQGQTVVRLKGGDPFLFGRGGEEAQELVEADLAFEIVPGVTSALAVPAYAGIPLTHRDHASAVAIVTGHKEVWDTAPHLNWATLAGVGGTLVFLMGTRQLRNNMQRLMRHGLSGHTPVALIRWGTRPDQDVLVGTVETIADLVEQRGFEPPAVAVVGQVVELRQQLRWFETKPLFGRRIVVTRPRLQAGGFVEQLEQHGAAVVQFPTIETVPVAASDRLDAALDALPSYDWAIFTSVNGVRYVFERLAERRLDIRSLAGVRLAAIGPETARALEARHVRVEAVPTEYRAEALLPVLGDVAGQRILLPRATQARDILPKALRAAGAEVDEIGVYQTVRPTTRTAQLRELLRAGQIDLITFTSSSTVRNFMAAFADQDADQNADQDVPALTRIFRPLLGTTALGCIGPITAETARSYGLRVSIQPQEYTIAAFSQAIVDYFRTEPHPNRAA